MISQLIYVVTEVALTTESFNSVTVCSSSSSSFFCSLLWSSFFGIKSSLSNPSFGQCLIPRCTVSSRLLSYAVFIRFQITGEQLDEESTLYLLKIFLRLWISDMVCVFTPYGCKCQTWFVSLQPMHANIRRGFSVLLLLNRVILLQIQRFISLSDLYTQIGFHRKASFCRRLAATRHVSTQNPQPNWAQCYQLMLQALSGHKLSLDPTEFPRGLKFNWNKGHKHLLRCFWNAVSKECDLNSCTLRVGCWGEYLDLRGRK